MLTTSITHKGILAGAKVLAGAVADCLCDPSIVAEAQASFREETADVVYNPLIPLDEAPRLGVHAALMERFRPLMRPHYLRERSRFR